VIPATVTRAVVANEMAAVAAWVARHPGWAAQYDDTSLQLVVDTTHPAKEVALRLTADLGGYRAIPPAWRVVDPSGGDGAVLFPQVGTTPVVSSSIFHPNRVICAPWNRLAYAEHGGPHGDWGALTNWLSAAFDSTKAETLADMLSQIRLHLSISPGVT
jgi:hypothetical protein